MIISVAMTTYNGADYIEKQLDSIYCQTKKVDEVIICDDQSKDETYGVINNYIQNHPDFNIILYKNEKNLGYRMNFLKAISLCKGNYIFLCDQDDIWENGKVEMMINKMIENRNICVLSSSFKTIDKTDSIIQGNYTLYNSSLVPDSLVNVKINEFIYHNYFQGCSLVFNEEIKNEFLKNYHGEIPHDWFINLLASKINGMYFLNHPLFRYRIHDNNTIGIPDMNRSFIDKLKSNLNYKARSLYVNDARNVINVLKTLDYQSYKSFSELADFCESYDNALKNKNTMFLVKNFSNGYYCKLAYIKARIMDILYSIVG